MSINSTPRSQWWGAKTTFLALTSKALEMALIKSIITHPY